MSYLTEAFRALNALNEDTFSVDDDGIKKLSEFEQNDDLIDEISVIDTDAETDDDLQNSYVGKVILDCSVCHSKLYKDKSEVELNDEGNLANVGEECPYCYTSDGFKVIGEVSEFDGDDEEENEEEDSDDTSLKESYRDEISDKYVIASTEGVYLFIKKGATLSTMSPDAESYDWSTKSLKDAMLFNSYDEANRFWDENDLSTFVFVDDASPAEYIYKVSELDDRYLKSLEEFLDADINLNLDGGTGNDVSVLGRPMKENYLLEGKVKDAIKKVATRVGADASTILRSFAELSHIEPLYDAATHFENKKTLRALLNGNEKVLNSCTKEDIEELQADIDEYVQSKKAKKGGKKSSDNSVNESTISSKGLKILKDKKPKSRGIEEGIFGFGKKKNKSTGSASKGDSRKERAYLIAYDDESGRRRLSQSHSAFDSYNSAEFFKRQLQKDLEGKCSNVEVISVADAEKEFHMDLSKAVRNIKESKSRGLGEGAMSGGYAQSGAMDTYKRAGGAKKKWVDALEGKPTKTVKAKDLKPGMVTDTGKVLKVTDIGWSGGKPSVEVSYGGIGAQGSYASDTVPADKDYKVLDESVNNVTVETDDDVISVETDETGKLSFNSEPKTADGGEMLSPVSDETQAEIEGNSEAPIEGEEPVEGEEGSEEDVDIGEFDEESFDELGESYLRNIYENVKSYKTTKVSSTDTKLKIEGLIKFTSGNQKKTSFIFESKDINSSGVARFIGENVNITKGKKAFTIRGKVNNGKFITESLNYNYKTKNDAGKTTRVYGTVKPHK